MDYKGKGWAARRAIDIRGIYELAAPVPGTVNNEPALKFMRGVTSFSRQSRTTGALCNSTQANGRGASALLL